MIPRFWQAVSRTEVRRRPCPQFRRVSIGFALLLALAATVHACSVPVFRYALDHWIPDGYHLYVFHRDGLSETEHEMLSQLRDSAANGRVNLRVELIDVNGDLDQLPASIWQAHQDDALPLCVVHQPTMQQGVYREVLAEPLSRLPELNLVDSPARRQIAEQLLAGTSVVWVYLESPSGEGDDARFAEVERWLLHLENTLTLPEIEPEDLPELATSPEELKLQFKAIRVARDDAAEAGLIETLLTTEADLRDAEFQAEPMLFPVFGRGRVLYSLIGKGINDQTVEDAARFLVGACQCTVKAENPGVDLLMTVDWDQLVTPSGPVGVDVPLTGLAAFQSDQTQTADAATVSIPTGKAVPSTGEAQTAEQSTDGATVEAPVVVTESPAGLASRVSLTMWLGVAVLATIVLGAGFLALPRGQ